MKLEDSLVGEISAGMMQMQSHLANLMLQIQDIKKGKEVHDEIWCNICRNESHHKDSCLEFFNYIA